MNWIVNANLAAPGSYASDHADSIPAPVTVTAQSHADRLSFSAGVAVSASAAALSSAENQRCSTQTSVAVSETFL